MQMWAVAVDDVVGVGTTGHGKKIFSFLRGELLTKKSCHPILYWGYQTVIKTGHLDLDPLQRHSV